MVNLWLDDVRPAPDGWVWVKTVEEAKEYLLRKGPRGLPIVVAMSLDHDLGCCPECLKGRTAEQWLEEHNYLSMPNCTHFGTGYDLVCWMEETGNWSRKVPSVHSANPAGRQKMTLAIEAERRRRNAKKPGSW